MSEERNTATRRLAEYAVSLRYEDLPPEVVERAEDLLLDFLGVALGGRALAPSTACLLATLRELHQGGPEAATVIGEDRLYPTHYAALLNGTFGHSLDFDDTHTTGHVHPASPIFSTALAVAEASRCPGREFLAAAVAGYDAACRIGMGAGWGVHDRGFHPTPVIAIFGAAAAGARLLHLSADELVNVWGINLSQAAGTHQYLENGSWTKRVQTGMAGQHAVVALALARNGLVGSADPLEGTYGFYRCYSEGGGELASALEGLGERFEISRSAVKMWPCCRANHPPIDGVLSLMREHGLSAGDVASVDIRTYPISLRNVGLPEAHKRNPRNVVEGQFSLFFTVALAVLEGAFTLDSYQRLQDPEVRAMMDRIHAGESGGLPVVTITTRGGATLAREVPFVKGDPESFPTREELLEKVLPLARAALPDGEVGAVVAAVRRLEETADVGALTRHLRAERGRSAA